MKSNLFVFLRNKSVLTIFFGVLLILALVNVFLPQAMATATDMLLSEVRISPAVTSPNLQDNPSFETWTSSTLDEPWFDANDDSIVDVGEYCDYDSSGTRTTYSQALFSTGSLSILPLGSTCGTFTEETTDPYVDTSAIKMATGASELQTITNVVGSQMSVSTSTEYTVSFYAKGESGSEKIYLTIYLKDGSAVEYNWNFTSGAFDAYSEIPSIDQSNLFTLTTSWARYTYTFTSDKTGSMALSFSSGTDGALLGRADTTNMTIYLDAAQVEAASAATTFMSADTASATFLELYNPTDSAIDIDNYMVQYRKASDAWAEFGAVTTTTNVPSGGFYLIKASGGDQTLTDETAFDVAYNASSGNMAFRVCTNSADCASTVIDTLGLASSPSYEGVAFDLSSWDTSMSFERKAYSASTVVTMSSGGGDVIAGNGYDSDVNTDDFVLRTTPDPQSLASSVEVYVAPVSTTTSSAGNQKAAQDYYDELIRQQEELLQEPDLPEVNEVPAIDETPGETEIDQTVPETDIEKIVPVVESTVPILPTEKNIISEALSLKNVVLLISRLPFGSDWDSVHFLSYGLNGLQDGYTQRDRVGLLNDYYNTNHDLPRNESDWVNIVRMADGLIPNEKVVESERRAIEQFVRIYKRSVDFSNKSDEKFVHMLAYGLRVQDRDLQQEQKTLTLYVSVFERLPDSSYHWSVLRAMAYSDVQ
ncbi:hypothetical protein COT97_00365 [Candidatus Falkowbacteria bacterium CG10_big_fil_rev_8_21_14_0_10_39_11]|uniref:Uncharacterized protein n=1 Tax=Candidatus Falkowbacteria bacterium CG10_big_fil_rev_8_21_14_0_10_39_11 TaxID=1974565 RepID=A0A2H0V6A1_9BACT|nr:MAG: hypothetical protein COT97_00365 [Candidatus Falkowbacteria bacterium CG10_big_fil_rev_8_21_14_0_10_39_11]